MGPSSASSSALERYLRQVEGRLEGEGFSSTRVTVGQLILTSQRSRFELTKFGTVTSAVHLFHAAAMTPPTFTGLAAAAFDALAGGPRPIRLPLGTGPTVFSIATAVVDGNSQALVELVTSTAPPKHWLGHESWAVYDLSSGRLSVLERTPFWGAAYAGSQRKLLRRLFS